MKLKKLNSEDRRSFPSRIPAVAIDQQVADPETLPPPGVSTHHLLRAKGSIYGTRDAGRSWWKKLHRTLKKYHWRVEAALSILVDDKMFAGIMASHVDDLFTAGEGSTYDDTRKELEAELYVLREERGASG